MTFKSSFPCYLHNRLRCGSKNIALSTISAQCAVSQTGNVLPHVFLQELKKTTCRFVMPAISGDWFCDKITITRGVKNAQFVQVSPHDRYVCCKCAMF